MSELRIDVESDRRNFTPGEGLAGRVSWRVDETPSSAELRLFWYTRGKGDKDVQVVDAVPFANPQSSDRREFRLPLPKEPYSFSGKLITLTWALELLVEPGSHVERRELVMSPSGQEIQIGHAAV